jgi:hypothetical protein
MTTVANKSPKKNNRNWVKFFFVVGFLATFFLFTFLLKHDERTFSNGVTIFGTYLSLFGIIISYLQIKSVKDTNELTKQAIADSLQRLNQLVVIADLSKAIKIIEEIQLFIQQQNYPIALIRMKDLKTIIIQAKHHEDELMNINTTLFEINVNELIKDIFRLEDYILGVRNRNFNVSKISKNLGALSTILTIVEIKLKNN